MTTRFRVYDMNDKLCGVWYAANEAAAIAAAIALTRSRFDAIRARVLAVQAATLRRLAEVAS